jgi:hypothetical protein
MCATNNTVKSVIENIVSQSRNPKRDAALYWHHFGFIVIPVAPGEKRPCMKWQQWARGQSEQRIHDFWTTHPHHDIAAILTGEYLVLDADAEASKAVLLTIEATFAISPAILVRTTRGEHHYFRCEADAYAKPDAHSTEEHPDRLDVRTRGSIIILPPSTGKTILVGDVTKAAEMSTVGQDLIDAVFVHNGRQPPRPVEPIEDEDLPTHVFADQTRLLKALLEHLDPDMGYGDWSKVLIAIYNVTRGSKAGFAIADAWSSKGEKYKGTQEIRRKWESFHLGPLKIGSLIHMVRETGQEWPCKCHDLEESFKVCEPIAIAA